MRRRVEARGSLARAVVMYPLVQLALEPDRHANVCAWLARLAARPSFVASEGVRPPAGSGG